MNQNGKLEEALRAWWHQRAEDEVTSVAPKAIEYGSRDLIEMGRTLIRVAGREVTDEEAAEAGIWFYVLGKIARWTAAIERGERVSNDTLLDIGIYVKMAQRLRAVGSWPGVEFDPRQGLDPEDLDPLQVQAEFRAQRVADHQQERLTLRGYHPEHHEWGPVDPSTPRAPEHREED